MLYQLGLIEVIEILKEKKYLEPIVNQIYAATDAVNQNDFIEELQDSTKMKPLSLIANEINEKLGALKKNVYSKQDIPEPKNLMKIIQELKGGAPKMTLDKLSSVNVQKLKESSDNNIRTIFIQNNHDLNLYITADKRTNSICVTFRGTQSLKNSLSDANIIPYKGCDGDLLDQTGGGFSFKSMKEAAKKWVRKLKIRLQK